MIASTRWLFLRLLRTLSIDTVCDVGSMNGADALAFRAVLPEASIYAFEANTHNFALMLEDRRLSDAEIELIQVAVTDYDGDGELFLVKADYSAPHDRRGMSSLHRRVDGTPLDDIAKVRTLRLDSWSRANAYNRTALWIDVEGKAYEVLDGAINMLASVYLIHVELETTPCIGPNQRLYVESKALLENCGFAELATDRSSREVQFNALFVRNDMTADLHARVRRELALARVRKTLGPGVQSIFPRRAARWLANHL